MSKNVRLLVKVMASLLATAVFLILALYILFGRGGEAEDVSWGVSFDPYYAESLGLDWQETYLSLLDDVGVDHLRIVAFWDALEPADDEFDFERLDFQMEEASKRNAKVILGVGRRLPRWPECHIPSWAENLSEDQQRSQVLELLPRIVNRYKDSPALEFWQVENEPYVTFFGECPGPSAPFVEEEMRVVESLDPDHPIFLTDSGELSLWFRISRLGDNLGISMYRTIYDGNYTHLYLSYRPFFPQQYYRIKANIYKRLGWLERIFVSELQAEPWGSKPLTEMSLEEQYITLSPEKLRYNINFARSTGFDRFYLWGAEWWFYARDVLGVPDFLEEASLLWAN